MCSPLELERLRKTEAKRRALAADLEHVYKVPTPTWREVERRMRKGLADWRARLTGDVAEARAGFRELLTTPIRFTPL